MKTLKLFLISFFLISLVYAEPLLSVDHKTQLLTTLHIDGEGNYVYTITLTPEQQKILEWQLTIPLQWIDTAVTMKLNLSGDRMLNKLSETTPMKKVNLLTKQEKEDLIANSTLKTRVERENK